MFLDEPTSGMDPYSRRSAQGFPWWGCLSTGGCLGYRYEENLLVG